MSECTCHQCVRACHLNPGWPTPEEAEKAIEAGHAGRLMLDWWVDFPGNIEILCPASEGFEGERAPEPEEGFIAMFSGWCKGRCTFLTSDNKCEIHQSGFKPQECREALVCSSIGGFAEHKKVAMLWNTDEARSLIERWKKLVNY